MTVIIYQVSNIKAKKNNYLNNFQHAILSLHIKASKIYFKDLKTSKNLYFTQVVLMVVTLNCDPKRERIPKPATYYMETGDPIEAGPQFWLFFQSKRAPQTWARAGMEQRPT